MAGLYLHIPFCKKKCGYCDFISFPRLERMGEYAAALQREIQLEAPLGEGRRFDTVFLGGGTPSLLHHQAVDALLEELSHCFSLEADAEITMECNPGTVTRESLLAYRRAGVNRLSLGMQSSHDGLLRAMGRIHTHRQFLEAFQWAREAGFRNINVDVMFGLPGQNLALLNDTLEGLCALGSEHVSAYSLILEEGTPLFRAVEKGCVALPPEEETADMFDRCIAHLSSRGLLRYEISNYAKPGFQCRHNLNYWRNGEYLGLGLAAHGALRLEGCWVRYSNVETLEEYLKALGEQRLPARHREQIPREEEMFECVMLGLRMIEGMETAAFVRRFGISPLTQYAAPIARLQARGWLEPPGDFLRLTPAGLDVQNRALGCFLQQ